MSVFAAINFLPFRSSSSFTFSTSYDMSVPISSSTLTGAVFCLSNGCLYVIPFLREYSKKFVYFSVGVNVFYWYASPLMISMNQANISAIISFGFNLKDLYLPNRMFVLVSLTLSISSKVTCNLSHIFLTV